MLFELKVRRLLYNTIQVRFLRSIIVLGNRTTDRSEIFPFSVTLLSVDF